MQESFLHFIWQYQYFDKKDLTTVDQQLVNIQASGFLNSDAGPDFLEAKLSLDNIDWRGSVEIHLKSSDWNLHQHQSDKAYNNVILHVVWEHDVEAIRQDGTLLPTLELKTRVDQSLIQKYRQLLNHVANYVPCETHFAQVADIAKIATLDKLAMERLLEKSSLITTLLHSNNGDWEETAYQLLAKNMGLKVNSEPFLDLAQSLPIKILKKHQHNLLQTEALLFGMAGFLNESQEGDYFQQLSKEFAFLKHKYGLAPKLNIFSWKFLRLRPANFPTLRLAQLATLIHQQKSIFASFLYIDSYKTLTQWLTEKPSEFWQKHYQFDKSSKQVTASLGKSTVDNIIINTAVPLLVAYGKSLDNQQYIEKAISWLENTKPENNKITRIWQALDFKPKTALDSQAQIQLYNQYCLKRRCLRCNIGLSIIKAR